ncbi:MAG TPA: hypothetical protein VF072_06160 [Thermoleophilaceae bacterium]
MSSRSHRRERRSIVLAAMDAIAAQGIAGLDAAAVGREAGLPAAIVRRHFPSTDRLAAEVLDHIVGELHVELTALAHLLTERPTLLLVFAELELRGRRDPLVRAAVERANRRWRAAVRSLLASHPDPDVAAAVLVAVVKGASTDPANAAQVLTRLALLLESETKD